MMIPRLEQLFLGFFVSLVCINVYLMTYIQQQEEPAQPHLTATKQQQQQQHSIQEQLKGFQFQKQQQQRPTILNAEQVAAAAAAAAVSSSINPNNNNNNNNNKKKTQNPNLIGSTGDPPPEKEEYHVPYNPIKNPNETIAVCMLIMDDNHRLTEWLAYHSYILPLGHLIVGVDPRSQSSPSELFDKWRRSHNITIDEWSEEQIYEGMQERWDSILAERRIKSPNQMIWAHDHRQRQNMFLRNCLVHMKEVLNQTWVLIVDSDEYLLYNNNNNGDDTEKKKKKPVVINQHPISINWKYPKLRRGTIVKDFLQSDYIRSLYPNPCIVIPRMLFGANESLPDDVQKGAPPGKIVVLNATKFDTLRYRHHIRRSVTHTHSKNGWAKVMVDVSRIDRRDFPTPKQAFQTFPYYMTVHEPIPKVCAKPFVKDEHSLLRINHYVGSWESFSYRNDARAAEGRGRQSWLDKAQYSDETDDTIREWITGYVDEVHDAKETVSQVGIFSPKTKQAKPVQVIPEAKAQMDKVTRRRNHQAPPNLD